MNISNTSINLISYNYNKLNGCKTIIFRSFSGKSFLPIIFGILIGFSLSKCLLILYPDYISDIGIYKNQSIDKNLADKLYNEVRVLCWVMTNSENHGSKARAVQETWGKRCNKLIFMSDIEDEGLGSIDLNVGYGRDILWAKTKEAFKYVYKNDFNDFDWFLKADDDTYVILENLRYFLYSYKPEDPIYFGCKFKPFVTQGYMSGGAGYVLSKEALRRFVEIALPDEKKCKPDKKGSEDIEMGVCLENVGVIAGDSRDSKGRRRFFPSGPDSHLVNVLPDTSEWYFDYAFYKIPKGLDCCSDYAISFHYVLATQMHFVDFAIYQIRPFGVVYDIDRLPDKISILLPDSKTLSETTSILNTKK